MKRVLLLTNIISCRNYFCKLSTTNFNNHLHVYPNSSNGMVDTSLLDAIKLTGDSDVKVPYVELLGEGCRWKGLAGTVLFRRMPEQHKGLGMRWGGVDSRIQTIQLDTYCHLLSLHSRYAYGSHVKYSRQNLQ